MVLKFKKMGGSLEKSIKYIELGLLGPPISLKLGMKQDAKMKHYAGEKKT
jgi:hypothetical protein